MDQQPAFTLPHDIKPLIRVWDPGKSFAMLLITLLLALLAFGCYRLWRKWKSRRGDEIVTPENWRLRLDGVLNERVAWDLSRSRRFYLIFRQALARSLSEAQRDSLRGVWIRSEAVVFGHEIVTEEAAREDYRRFTELLSETPVAANNVETLLSKTSKNDLYPSDIAKQRVFGSDKPPGEKELKL